MRRALVFGAIVVDVVDAGAEFPTSPELVWVDCPDDAAAYSHEWNGAGVVPRLSTKAERNARRKARLAELDAKSVRGMREFVMAKWADDAALPAAVKKAEADAIAERAAIEQ